MAFDTLRTNKMRSALTVLGVVIGITSIVGMTSLIRGFDESLRDSIRQLGPNTIFVQKCGALSFAARQAASSRWCGARTSRCEDARAIAARAAVGGDGGRLARRDAATAGRASITATSARSRLAIIGATENLAAVNFAKLEAGRFFMPARGRAPAAGRRARPTPWQRCSRTSIRSARRSASAPTQFTVVGVLRQAAEPGRLRHRRGRLRRHSRTRTHEKFYGKVLKGSARSPPAASTRQCSARR